MPGRPSNLRQFWQELKRRKVVRVITVYAAASFVILELVDIVSPSLRLPEWTMNFIIVLLCVGFIITVVVSWVYDVTPEGIEKTKPAHKVKSEDKPISSNSWRIASYISFVVIVGLIALNVIPRSNQLKEITDLEKSIAVLPFANMSSDKEQDYFCYGITEDILNYLIHIEGIHVVSRTSSFAFKDKNLDIREIGKKLGVHNIVEGSVRKDGNHLRITAQLINVDDGFHLWSERYDRDLKDVFAIQNEIAQNIVQALEIKLSKREKHELVKVKTENVKAYDFYIQGRTYYRQLHHSSTKYAIDLFSRAIQIDKNYALAYAGLADSYSQFYMYFDRNEDNLKQALAASQKALELDPELAEAHSSRGIVLTQIQQYKEAEKEFEIAIQLNPKLFVAYYQGGRTYRVQGKHEQALRLFGKATHVRPEDYESAIFLAGAYGDLKMKTEMKKANQRALELVRKHLELYPDDARAYYLGASTLIKEDEGEEALKWTAKSVSIAPNETTVLYNAACIYSLLGEVDMALDYFEKAIDSGYASREWIENDSDFDLIRDHPRFKKILEKLD
jgi:adenylate cyclase